MTSSVDVGISGHLGGEMCLPRTAAEQAAQETVLHVHFVNAFLDLVLDGAYVWTSL